MVVKIKTVKLAAKHAQLAAQGPDHSPAPPFPEGLPLKTIKAAPVAFQGPSDAGTTPLPGKDMVKALAEEALNWKGGEKVKIDLPPNDGSMVNSEWDYSAAEQSLKVAVHFKEAVTVSDVHLQVLENDPDALEKFVTYLASAMADQLKHIIYKEVKEASAYINLPG